MGRQQWPTVILFARQEGNALFFAPVFIATQAEVIGDFGHGRGMARRVLTHIEAHQEQAERHGPAQAIEQRTVGDHAHAALMQRVVAQLQRVEQFAVVLQYIGRCRRWRRQRGVRPVSRRAQSFAQLLEHRAIGFGAVASLGLQRFTGLLHRQLGSQMIDIAQVQIGRHPARQQQHFTGHRRRHVRVAVAVAAHPRGKTNRCCLQWQTQAGGGVQGLIGLAQVIGDRLPQRMFDHRETPFGFVDRRRARAANFFGVPGFGDQALQRRLDLLALGAGQVAMVLGRQLRGDGVVFLDQRAARDFGRVRGQHQLDFQPSQLTGQGLGAMTFGAQAGEQLRQHPRLEWRGLGFFATVNQLVLLGDVGQVEKLVERPRHRQQFVLRQLVEAGAQLGVHGTATVSLGALADLLDLVEKAVPVLFTNGVAQQLTQQVNVFAQACINIGHQQFSSEKSGRPGTLRVPLQTGSYKQDDEGTVNLCR